MLERIMTLTFLSTLLTASVRMAMPLMYAGLGEMIAEKAGVMNIGMEGVMLSGAFFAFAGAYFSSSLAIGLLAGMLGGLLVSLVHALLSIKLSQDQSVSGIAINIFMGGVTSFLYRLMNRGQSYQQISTFPKIAIPGLSGIPLVGSALFNQDVLTYAMYFLIPLSAWFYAKTTLGLSCRAIGENPVAADSAGVPVHRYQLASTVLNGLLGGIGGAFLVLVQVGGFSENMTSGRGYIALAAVILGRTCPEGVLLASLLFGAANALQIRLQAIGVPLPTQALAMLPYIITLLALLFSIGKNKAPEALAKPYIRGQR